MVRSIARSALIGTCTALALAVPGVAAFAAAPLAASASASSHHIRARKTPTFTVRLGDGTTAVIKGTPKHGCTARLSKGKTNIGTRRGNHVVLHGKNDVRYTFAPSNGHSGLHH
ncbi:hypothetical protein [Streptomyces sp. NPDC101181]|uniref:hypothetical protein n=1 Tax=Streptomyces sp. NPDC101181 TaxID=3366125 RepID=UPI00381ABE6D